MIHFVNRTPPTLGEFVTNKEWVYLVAFESELQQLVDVKHPFSAQIYGYIKDERSGVESYPYPV